MEFIHYDLKHCKQGQKVEITLKDNTANVLLLDDSNFQKYKRGRDYNYCGGHMIGSVSHLLIPRPGHWHVVVNRGGFSGSVQSSVRLV